MIILVSEKEAMQQSHVSLFNEFAVITTEQYCAYLKFALEEELKRRTLGS